MFSSLKLTVSYSLQAVSNPFNLIPIHQLAFMHKGTWDEVSAWRVIQLPVLQIQDNYATRKVQI
jgi:hypothetical protein